MNCPHCNKVIVVKIMKDSNVGQSQPSNGGGAVGQLLAQIDDDTLTGKAVEFIQKTRERYEKWGEKIMLSDPQRSWLEDIAAGKAGRSDDWS